MHPNGEEFAISRSGDVLVIDSENGEVRQTHVLGGSDAVIDQEIDSMVVYSMSSTLSLIQYSPDGRFLAAVSGAKGIWVWDAQTGKEVYRNSEARGAVFLAFSFDGSRMVSCSSYGKSDVRVFDTRNWREVIPGRTTPVSRSAVSLSSDGRRLFIGLSDSRMEVWDLDVLAHSSGESSGGENSGDVRSGDKEREGRRTDSKAARLSKLER